MSRHGPYHVAHHSTRNPWSGGHCSESVSSSASSQTYHVIPPNQYVQMDPCWDGSGQYHLLGGRSLVESSQPGLATAVTPTGVYLLPKPAGPARPVYYNQQLESTGRRSRPLSSRAVTPVSTGGVGSSETAVLPCGGHCIALETFCHHFLQVAFVAGVLTGVCLIVAGSVLSGRRGDLGVLTYIGTMVSLVSALLLSIQCCSKPRPRPRRLRPPPPPPRAEDIPMRPLMTAHHQPPQHQHHGDENGIPWWRREETIA